MTIPNSVTSIDGAFSRCRALISLRIPNSVTSIFNGSFTDCSGLTSIIVESGNGVYDSRNNCNAIIETKSDKLILGCNNTIIPNSITSIEVGAFYNCTGLTSVVIPSSITSIPNSAFSGCTGLTSIKLPNSVTSIGSYAFYGCSSLTSIRIPVGVTSIESSTFQNCGLTSVIIGSGVIDINWNAFAKCEKLTDVYCLAMDVPSTSSDAFEDCHLDLITLHIPESAFSAYMAESPWNGFKQLVALPKYQLTYVIDGEVYKTFMYEEERLVPKEPEPTKNGYEFSGWSEIPKYMPENDLTIVGSFDLIADYDEIKIGSTGKATFSSKYDLDFSAVEGLKAYTATGYENEDATVWLSRVLRVPAGTGLMVKGDAGTYKVPHTTSASYYTNLFRANTGGQISIGETDGEWTNYYLSGGQFKKVNGNANIGHKKCYLQLPSRFFSKTRSIEVIYDDEEATGIMDNAQWITDKDNDAWYNINGQRISQPTKKGLYIHKGKKVVIK